MSLILEALKKSEARRQLGETPGIGTPFTVARRRHNPLPLIAVLIAAAAALGWYYVRTLPPTASTASPAPAAQNSNIVAQPAARKPPAGLAPNRPNGADAASSPAGAEMARRRLAGMPPGTPGARGELPGRAEGVNPAAPGPTVGMAAQYAARRQALAHPPENVAAPGPDDAAPAHASAPAANAAPPLVASAAHPAVATAQPPKPEPPATAPATTSAAQDLPLYYELPYNVRKDLPVLTISMHVYAAAPEQRFVMIDGERKTEGETVHEGLTLREIRPDGLVLEFRGQRFFYPRPGR